MNCFIIFLIPCILSMVPLCLTCRCAAFRPEHYYCRADYVLKVRVKGKNTVRSDDDHSGTGLPSPYFHLTTYDIDVKDVFKANSTIKGWLRNEPKIWVDGFAAQCGTTLFKGHDFIIAGRVRDSKLWASACGYVRDVSLMNENDKKFFDQKIFKTIECESQ